MKHFEVVPECYVDTNLISTLISSKVNHQYGCSKVSCILEQTMKDRFAVGIIDKDKKIKNLKYVDQFTLIAQREHLELYKHPSKPHYFILIKPAADKFIMDSAAAIGVNLADYGFPTSLKAFIKVTKQEDSNENPIITRLIKDIEESPEVKALKTSLAYLLERNFSVNVDELKNIFLA